VLGEVSYLAFGYNPSRLSGFTSTKSPELTFRALLTEGSTPRVELMRVAMVACPSSSCKSLVNSS
jgi:hypothetical protein